VKSSDLVVRRPATTAQVTTVDGDRVETRRDHLATEEPMEIRVQGPGQEPVPFAVAMRTPGNDYALECFGQPPKRGAYVESLENLCTKYVGFQQIAVHRPIPHEAWYNISGYFYLYGFYHAAVVLNEKLPDDVFGRLNQGRPLRPDFHRRSFHGISPGGIRETAMGSACVVNKLMNSLVRHSQ